MHQIQQDILNLAEKRDIKDMTLREVGALIGVDHPQKVKHHLVQLLKRGMIPGSEIEQNEVGVKTVRVPIVGSANCGPATLFAEGNIEGYLRVSESLVGKAGGLFALKAIGRSMNRTNIDGKSIDDGDYVVVDSKSITPSSGKKVVSMIDGSANVKRIFYDRQSGQIQLISESEDDFSPIYIGENDDFAICGTVIQVLKKPAVE